MGARIGVVLSGCGFQDGAEIHESVLTLLAIERGGAEAVCFAPDRDQAKVVNHLTGEETGETRNVLVESARIARGAIRDVTEANADELDALILPGGFGAALNLSTFATQGPDAEIDPGVAALVQAVYAQKKPIGAICIAPGLIAKALGEHAPTLTIGNDAGTAQAIEACGAKHQECPVEDFVVDTEHRIVSTPAYMLGPGVKDVAAGIERCVAEVLRLVEPAAVA
ncbi:MAG: isoprenoid biosynthesis glyoxalase ElbB [Planctomycetota bacterium]|nr:isoprenoid biosynthesis glyoxalase ElbB [Planctomycetota bacterium]